jgi:hypothetical protein
MTEPQAGRRAASIATYDESDQTLTIGRRGKPLVGLTNEPAHARSGPLSISFVWRDRGRIGAVLVADEQRLDIVECHSLASPLSRPQP